MKPLQILRAIAVAWMLAALAAGPAEVVADDTCMFIRTADDVPPNIVILLDSGTVMEHVLWHPDFDNNIDFTPAPVSGNLKDAIDFPNNDDPANGFYNTTGYFIDGDVLAKINPDLSLPRNPSGVEADDNGKFLINGRSIYLPPTSVKGVEYPAGYPQGIIDNAETMRYSANYLNWLFFHADADKATVYDPVTSGAVPIHTRFYEAKKAIMTVGRQLANRAQLSIYYFVNTDGGSSAQPLKMACLEPLAADPQDNVLTSAFVNNVNNMGTVTYSPLAEGLATVGGYYSSPSSGIDPSYCTNNYVIVVTAGESSMDDNIKNGVPDNLGNYDGDATDTCPSGVCTLPLSTGDTTFDLNLSGTSYLDDIAYFLNTNDVVDYVDGYQPIFTYTISVMANEGHNAYLVNTSNNGNELYNVYDTTNPDYGGFNFEASTPEGMAQALLDAITQILKQTSSFVAPVVPVTRTYSGDRIYMAFFKPSESNFWQGNVTKYGIGDLDRDGDGTIEYNQIVGRDPANPNECVAATYPNGAMKETDKAAPFWQTIEWADENSGNGINHANRNIYTYAGDPSKKALTDPHNDFVATNAAITAEMLGSPSSGTANLINYIRGADVYGADPTKNRDLITGDVLHSEPLVVRYVQPARCSLGVCNSGCDQGTSYVFFGSNDGMLHAVRDSDGTEAWAFIPPNQLPRLKGILEGTGHQYFVDSSPKAYINDANKDGEIHAADGDQVILVCGERKGSSSYFAIDITSPEAPVYLWRIAYGTEGILTLTDVFRHLNGSFNTGDPLRYWVGNGAEGYNGEWLDNAIVAGPESAGAVSGDIVVTYHSASRQWSTSGVNGNWAGNLDTQLYRDYMDYRNTDQEPTTPFVWGRIKSVDNFGIDIFYPVMGQSWSEPVMGKVKTSDADTTGTPVFFIGGGYDPSGVRGKAIMAINVLTGSPVKVFANNGSTITGMDYPIVSTVKVVDGNGNGFIDKVYVGDTGGQMWRIGKFTDSSGNALEFPLADENISNWQAQMFFDADPSANPAADPPVAPLRTFFYPPSVTLERGFDMVSMGTGNREDACNRTSLDKIYGVKDTHRTVKVSAGDNLAAPMILSEDYLVDMTDSAAAPPNLKDKTGDVDNDSKYDQGYFIGLGAGEKVLSEGTVFYKVFFTTTFRPTMPDDDDYDECLPGGFGRVYGMSHLTGEGVEGLFGSGSPAPRSIPIGGGIPSKPIIIISRSGPKMYIAEGSTLPDDEGSESFEAGVIHLDPLFSEFNFFEFWWRDF